MHQIQIAGGVLGQEHDGRMAGAHLATRPCAAAVMKVDGDLQADDRLHALFRQLSENSRAPKRLFESVIASAGIASAMASLASVATVIAPSRTE